MNGDLNIKPSLQDKIASKYYKPYYLNPFGYSSTYKNLNYPPSKSSSPNNESMLAVEKNVNKRRDIIYKNPAYLDARPGTAN